MRPPRSSFLPSRGLGIALGLFIVSFLLSPGAAGEESRPRARDLGIVVGVFPPGPWNAITDVEGVRVGHETLVIGDDVRTGVTAIVPGPGNLYTRPVPAALHVGNGYGKLVGATQLREFGELETPVLLTCTLCVWSAARGLVHWLQEQPGIGEHTINPVVGETNDGRLNDLRGDAVDEVHVRRALERAKGGPVVEGSVGAGTGTQAFGWKGGIGTSSRVLPAGLGGWTLGVLVQTNFGGSLQVNGVPVGRILGRYAFREALEGALAQDDPEDGSIMIVVATDAPVDSPGLERIARRAMLGLARTGSFAHNGSGDYVIAFSTAPGVRRPREARGPAGEGSLVPTALSPLFAATVEATEEAIYNALLRATTVRSTRGELEAIDPEAVRAILERHGALDWDRELPPGRSSADDEDGVP